MTKFVMLLVITVAIIATYTLTGDPTATALLGSAAAAGGVLARRFTRKTEPEVTSEPAPTPIFPTFTPRTLAERRAEAMRIAATPVEDEGELLPPTPNMGDFGVPYRGPKYFSAGEK